MKQKLINLDTLKAFKEITPSIYTMGRYASGKFVESTGYKIGFSGLHPSKATTQAGVRNRAYELNTGSGFGTNIEVARIWGWKLTTDNYKEEAEFIESRVHNELLNRGYRKDKEWFLGASLKTIDEIVLEILNSEKKDYVELHNDEHYTKIIGENMHSNKNETLIEAILCGAEQNRKEAVSMLIENFGTSTPMTTSTSNSLRDISSTLESFGHFEKTDPEWSDLTDSQKVKNRANKNLNGIKNKDLKQVSSNDVDYKTVRQLMIDSKYEKQDYTGTFGGKVGYELANGTPVYINGQRVEPTTPAEYMDYFMVKVDLLVEKDTRRG